MYNYDEFVEKYGREVADRVRQEAINVVGSKWKVHIEHAAGMNFIFVASNVQVAIIVEKNKSLYAVTNFTRFQAEKGLELMNILR